tara:strand:- start:81 stop:284 length:204 start_codon:yes stop_codon:yes gene_type:complete
MIAIKTTISKIKLSLNFDIIFTKVTRNGKNKKMEYSFIIKTRKIELIKKIERNKFLFLSLRLFPKKL